MSGKFSPFYKSFLILLALMLMLPAGAWAVQDTGVVQGGKLNLREEPNTTSKVIGQYDTGVWVQILSRGGSWYKVRTEDGRTGYMSANYIVTENLATVTYATVHTANGGKLNLREEPSFSAKVLGAYRPGTQVQVLLYGTDWDRVKVNSKTGYMRTKFLTSGGTPAAGQGTVTSSGGKVNLREDASYTARVLSQHAPGTKVDIIQAYAKNGWHKVRVGGKTGYMDAAFVLLPHRTATVSNPNTGRLNLRNGPSFDGDILATFKNGTQVEVLLYGDAWCYVKVNGLSGYMVTMYLSFPPGR